MTTTNDTSVYISVLYAQFITIQQTFMGLSRCSFVRSFYGGHHLMSHSQLTHRVIGSLVGWQSPVLSEASLLGAGAARWDLCPVEPWLSFISGWWLSQPL